jgi:predicted permease
MLINYLKIALRNITRHKGYAAINITGLAIGIAASLLIFIVIRYELSYDRFQPNFDHIYHVVTSEKTTEEDNINPGVPVPALEVFRIRFPQSKVAGIFSSYGSQFTIIGNDSTSTSIKGKYLEETGVFFAEPEFLEVFTYTWLNGSPSVLAEPNAVVLSKSVAEKYFGSWQQANGQFIKMDNNAVLMVKGVIDNTPLNSDFPIRIVSSYVTLKNNPGQYFYQPDWNNLSSSFQVYMRLPENVSTPSVDQQLLAFSREQYKNKQTSGVRTHFLRPLSEIHFDTRTEHLGDHVTSKPTLWTLSLIGIMIILMAGINFINLSTAQAISRSKEVGLRKVLGGNRLQLMGQMLGETAVIVFIALILGTAIAFFCVPYLDQFINIPEKLSLFNSKVLGFMALLFVLVTIFSGFYPSLVLSGFKPALAIKNKISSASIGGISLRRGLVVLQFAISQLLIIGTIVALSQMKFIRNEDLGFKKEAVLVLSSNNDSAVISRQKAFKNELLTQKGIQSVSFSSDMPSSENIWSTNFAFDGKDVEDFEVCLKFADADYFKTYGFQFVAGKGLSVSDTTNEIVVNETLVKKLGLKDPAEAVGKNLRLGGGRWKPIVGVVKDFKPNTLREKISPIAISSRSRFYGVTNIKLSTSNLMGVEENIQRIWDKYFPEYVNKSEFMDETIHKFYKQETQLTKLYQFFALLAIFISCLGLYGLVSFMAVQKTKEVGIRKVLGASVGSIVLLFSKEFTLLIFVAFLVAAPLAWWLMSEWLSNFVFKINLGVWIFITAIVVSIVIAWITVGFKAVRAALVNPVNSLRSE